MFQTRTIEKIKHAFYVPQTSPPSPENDAVHEIICEIMAELCG
jgi:hypothetical protein